MSATPNKTTLTPSIAKTVLNIIEVVTHGRISETQYQSKSAAGAVKVLDEVFVAHHGYIPTMPRYSAGGVFAIINTQKDTIFTVMQTNDVERFYIIKTNAQYKHVRAVSCEDITKAMSH